jgi:hypothetical protein
MSTTANSYFTEAQSEEAFANLDLALQDYNWGPGENHFTTESVLGALRARNVTLAVARALLLDLVDQEVFKLETQTIPAGYSYENGILVYRSEPETTETLSITEEQWRNCVIDHNRARAAAAPAEVDVWPGTAAPMNPEVEETKSIPRDEANIIVRNHSRTHPDATAREFSALGIALGTLPKLPAYIAHQVRKAKAEADKTRTPRTIRLTTKMLEALGRRLDVEVGIEIEEAAWEYLLNQASPAERAELLRKKSSEKAKLIKETIASFADQCQESE